MTIIYGTSGDDQGQQKLAGTALVDIIYGIAGHDELWGLEGIDHLYGGTGNDVLKGHEQSDVLVGGAGADQLQGGTGNDTASYHLANGGVTVSLSTSSSNGQGFGDEAQGDVLSLIENLTGSNHADNLIGNAGANILTGNSGNDTLLGGKGEDELYGGYGDDLLQGGAHNDTINGSDGNDTVSYADMGNSLEIFLNEGWTNDYDYYGVMHRDALISIENAIGGAIHDDIYGTEGQNRLEGLAGNDDLYGNGGSDQLHGGTGNDELDGGAGADLLNGGSGVDTIYYASASTGITIDLTSGAAGGGAAGDQFSGIENVTGSLHADTIMGDSGANELLGQSGNDWLNGREGNDMLKGYLGNDWFFYSLNDNANAGGDRDLIRDFVHGEDELRISVINNWGEAAPDTLYVSGQAVFDALDSNNDNRLSATDQWVDLKNLNVNGQSKMSLVLDIGAGVGEQLFGGAGEDTLTLFGVTNLFSNDFA